MTLRKKVLLPLAFFSALLVGYLYGYWMPRSLDTIRDNYQSVTGRHLDSVVEGLVPLLLARQLDTVYGNLDALRAKNRDWVNIELRDAKGRLLYPLSEASGSKTTRSNGEVHVLKRPIDYLGESLGVLTVTIDFRPWLNKAEARQQELMVVLLAGIGAFFLMAGFLLERLVLQPVNALSNAATALAQNRFEGPLDKSGDDEVGNLVDRFAEMREAIRGYQAALRASEHEFRTLAENAPDVIARYDTAGACLYVNPKFERVHGLSARDVIGKTPAGLPGEWGPAAAAFTEKLTAATASGEGASLDLSWMKDGKRVYWFVRIVPEFSEDGRVSSALTIWTDITKRRQAEEALRCYRDQLEETVQRRTAELLLARDAAEAANKAKSVFLANMSHELRTPLNAILGFSAMLRAEPVLARGQREKLDIIYRSGEHLLTLIDQVLEVAKIEAGRLQLENAPFDLEAMVRDVTAMMRLRAGEKGLQLRVDQSSAFPRYIKGDEARLRQVMLNLVGNAVKFTHRGAVTIRLGARKNGGQHLVIEVEDTGPGIAPEDQKRLFKPFVQLGETGAQKGTGLGLAISRQFIEAMGGAIGVTSTVGKGSVFRVEVPVEMAAAAVIADLQRRAENTSVTGLAPGQPAYRILIAEDQRENQLLLAGLMAAIGLEAKVANNGQECVKLFQEWEPHLIWMDRRMPVMDGMEATRTIRALPGGRDVKIVAVTASVFKEQQQEMLDAGMDEFVSKPYRAHEIYGCLARHLGLKYVCRAAEEETVPMRLTPAAMAVLPDAMRKALRDALESLDAERIAAVVREAQEVDARLGRRLERLTDNFEYPAILEALAQQKGT